MERIAIPVTILVLGRLWRVTGKINRTPNEGRWLRTQSMRRLEELDAFDSVKVCGLRFSSYKSTFSVGDRLDLRRTAPQIRVSLQRPGTSERPETYN